MADGLESLSQPMVHVLSLLEPIVSFILKINDLVEDISWKQYTTALIILLLSCLSLWTIFSEKDFQTIHVNLPEAAQIGWKGEELDNPSIKVSFSPSTTSSRTREMLTRYFRNLV